jgi:hypothetical protein
MTITVVPQIAMLQAAVAKSQKETQAELVEAATKLATDGVRFADSRGRDIMRHSGFLAGLREVEWALTDEAEKSRPLSLSVANLLLDLSGIQAATAEGVNLPQRSPDFIEGKVAAVRGVSRMLVDMLTDEVRDAARAGK